MSFAGTGRGRGRGRFNQLQEPPTPGLPQDPPESTTASAITPESDISSLSRRLSEITTRSDEVFQPERLRRGNPPRVLSSAPRGIGISTLTSELSSVHLSSSTGRSSARSVPSSTTTESASSATASVSGKQGTSGDPINIIANYVKVLTKPQWELFQYHVQFSPDIVNKRFRRDIIAQNRAVLKDVAFDGRTIYTFNDLGDTQTWTGKDPGTNGEVQVTMKQVARNSPESPAFFHMANLIVRKLLEITGMKLIGRNYYQLNRKIDLDQYNLTLFPGFLTSINIYEHSLLMNVDLTHRVLNRTTVYQRLQDIFSQHQNIEEAQNVAIRELVGQIVLTTYNSSTYKIDEIAWEQSPADTFTLNDKTQCTFVKYYENKYQLTILDKAQPLLLSRPSKKRRRAGFKTPFLLIPEFCCITGITDMMRSDFQFMKELSSYTYLNPRDRHARLQDMVSSINQNKQCQEEFEKWNMKLDNDLIRFEGRVLDTEYIHYFDRSIRYNCNDADWSRESRQLRHICAKSLINWLVVFPAKDQSASLALIDAIVQASKSCGMYVEYPHIRQLVNDRPDSYLATLQESVTEKTDLVVCVLTTGRKDRYDALKKYLCLDNPVPSQMVQLKTLARRNQLMSVAIKISLQINAKLGGEIWGVEIPTKTLMVIGIDCHHDKRRRHPSVNAFVASVNPTLTKFYSRVIFQQTTQEFSDSLSMCIRDSLKEYHRNNNSFPDKIVIYRDGVADGQLNTVMEHEVSQIIQTFPKILPNYEPKLAIIIVKKRGNARFFQQDGRNILNPSPGTIIDTTVTHPDWYDFYLISQCARQGTISPTHYNVIWDRTTFKVDHMQRLTFKLCHLYYNWPGTIRVPAVCQYAHKLAFLVGQNLHQDFSHTLADKLFYL